MTPDAARELVSISRWLDAHNGTRDPEAITWARIAKVSEEHGEAVAAFIGATGQNPRKGVTHTIDDVVEELLDVAVTALGAIEHLRGNDGDALDLLAGKIARVAERTRTTGPVADVSRTSAPGASACESRPSADAHHRGSKEA